MDCGHRKKLMSGAKRTKVGGGSNQGMLVREGRVCKKKTMEATVYPVFLK